ncbi:MAG TPA: hypothetical protein VN969_38825 [Streptosporangiaceae bacterium]|nr:hypothetical protein [Streptosporangiaceae bacterium]
MTIPDMTENVLDTTVHEPPTTSGIDLLIFALERSRAQFAWKCGGLDEGDFEADPDWEWCTRLQPPGPDLLREAVDGLTGANPPQP